MAVGKRTAGRPSRGILLNCALAALLAAAVLFALFLLPLWLMPLDRLWAWSLVPVALLTPSHWALLHEAIHGLFHPEPRLNRAAGRALSILGGSSFRVLRFGHLMHHRFNRYRMDRPDCFDPAEIPAWRARLRYFFELAGGFYLIEVAIPPLFLLPRSLCVRILERIYAHPDATVQQVGSIARQTFLGPRALAELRQDAGCIALLIGASAFAWGADWPLLIAFVLGRGAVISFLDNVYHYRTPLDRVDFAYNLELPRPMQLLILNMNLHRVHHREPHLPWWRLPARFREVGDGYDGGYGRAAMAQLRGPLPVSALAAGR